MDYNLAGIRQRVLIDKLDDDEFDPNVVDNFINDTQRDIFNQFELPFMEKIFSGSLPTGSTMFTLPSDVAVIQSQVITSPDGQQKDMANGYLDFRTFNKLYPTPANNTASEVVNWTSYAGNMITSAPTDQDYTMTIYYIKKPKVLSQGTDVPDVPEEFSEALVLGALRRVQERNEDYDLAGQTQAAYTGMVMQMAERYGFRISNGPIKMKNQQMITR